MKTTQEFIVFRNKKNGSFLKRFKNRDSHLTFEAELASDIQYALILEEKHYLHQEKELSPLAEALGCEPIRVKAEYTLETMDGQPAPEIEEEEDETSELADLFLEKMLGLD